MAARTMPYTQIRSLDTLKSLFTDLGYSKPKTDEYHRIRSQIFAQVEHLSAPFLAKQVECLSNDQLLTHAENVGTPAIFPNHPAAHDRLDALARRYIDSFQQLQESVLSSAFFPREGAQSLIIGHIAFRDAYVAEYKRAYPSHTTVVRYTRNPDIAYLKRAINSALDEMHSSDKALFIQKMKDLDPGILLLIPKMVFLAAVKSDGSLPQFFQRSETQIQVLREQYLELTTVQQENLLFALLGKSPRESTSVSLLEAIEGIAVSSTRGELDGAILQNVIESY